MIPPHEVTKCLPDSSPIVPEVQFPQCIGRLPVETDYAGSESWRSTNLDFPDFGRMRTIRYKLARGRRNHTPAWARNKTHLGQVIIAMLMMRALTPTQRARLEGQPLRVQYDACRAALQLRAEKQRLVLADLCQRYVAAKKAGADVRILCREITALDTFLRIADNMGGILYEVIHLYLLCGYDSVETANELGLKSCHVRQLLRKLGLTARKLGLPE